MGLTKQQIIKSNLPLPHQDFVAETPEERLVMYADKFHSKVPQFNSLSLALTSAKKFGYDNEARFNALLAEFGAPKLDELAKTYNQNIV